MAVSGVVCGPDGASGVTYAMVEGQKIGCGADSAGNPLTLQVSTLGAGDAPVDGGAEVGLEIGGAVLSVMAMAWGVRVMRRLFESSGEA